MVINEKYLVRTEAKEPGQIVLGESTEKLRYAFMHRESFDDEGGPSVLSTVYPVVRMPNFLEGDFLCEICRELENFEYRYRCNDLYRFSQTGDLKSRPSQVLDRLKESLLSDRFIGTVEGITRKPLSRKAIDLSSQKYGKNEYLLTHDDRLDSRRVAFVLYLVDDRWNEEDGGSLDFFPTDWRGLATDARGHQSFHPQRNTLVFFEVGMASHHQVGVVLSDLKGKRVSIAGWFHDATQTERGEQGASALGESFTEWRNYFHEPSFTGVPQLEGARLWENAAREEFLMEIFAFAEFRASDAIDVHSTRESFGWYQEVEEPKWLRILTMILNDGKVAGSFRSKLPTICDFPGASLCRPVIKFYRSPHHYRRRLLRRHSDKVDASSDDAHLRMFLIVEAPKGFVFPKNSIVIPSQGCSGDLAIPFGQKVTFIEISFAKVD